jgi:HEAT repeat protein
LFAATASADDKGVTPGQADAAAAQAARDVLGAFDKGDPGWKVRMEGLIRLAKAGPGVTPVLTDALKKGPPSTREFAAQALVLFAGADTRPALEQALDDPESGVRIYAIHALSMLGRLPRTERHLRMLAKDPDTWGVRPMMAAALERDDRPDPAALRKALSDYDRSTLDSARVGHTAPDFTLADFTGKARSLSEFRGKKTVVLRFILFDF